MMFNGQIGFNVKTYQTVEELVADFERVGAWTLCTGFRVGNVMLLNDSSSEDSVQEYALVQVKEETDTGYIGDQIESFTMSWMPHDDKIRAVKEMLEYIASGFPSYFTWIKPITVLKHSSGSCPYCA